MSYCLSCVIISVLCLVRAFQGCPVIVERGQSASLDCTFINNVRSVTWQLLGGAAPVNLTTCSFVDNACNNTMPDLYKGQITSSAGTNQTILDITRANTTQTNFTCLADNGQLGDPCPLEVYVWPSKPVCSNNVTDTYMEITCTTAHVYPDFDAVLHRNEHNLTKWNFESGYPNCTLGSGSTADGDYNGSCTWRVSMNSMYRENSFYVDMTARVSNLSIVNKTVARSYAGEISFDTTDVVINKENCPVGPDVSGVSVRVGTNATCKCEVKELVFPPTYAQWRTKNYPYTIVGQVNKADHSSTLTVSYNASDPDQSYKCTLNTPILGIFSIVVEYKPTFHSSLRIVEKGHPTSFQYTLQNDAKSVTWQLLQADSPLNLTTCNLVNNICPKLNNSQYTGDISSAGDRKVAQLNIGSARTNETKFAFVADNGEHVDTFLLEVYAWPTKLNCQPGYGNRYTSYSCTTYVYPEAIAVIHRRPVDLTMDDFEYSGNSMDYFDTRYQTFQWTIPNDRMYPDSEIYVEMTAKVSNTSLINNTPVVSAHDIINLNIPEMVIKPSNCPKGPKVKGDDILNGTTATCKCERKVPGDEKGFARWYNEHNEIVGQENRGEGSSTITVSYNSSDINQTYRCWPIIDPRPIIPPIIYTPKFVASLSHGTRSEVHPLVIVIATISSGFLFFHHRI